MEQFRYLGWMRDDGRLVRAIDALPASERESALTHQVHILEMNGDSYRLKQSKRKQKSQPACA
ncbi:MAG: hypothetical protein RB191_16915, partial [Terriglobia bacterium]|nr:hypothetical protein [Terriglobia bacterium]